MSLNQNKEALVAELIRYQCRRRHKELLKMYLIEMHAVHTRFKMTEELTSETKLLADNPSVSCIPSNVTDSSPLVIIAYLHCTILAGSTTPSETC